MGPDFLALLDFLEHDNAYLAETEVFADAMNVARDGGDWWGWSEVVVAYDRRVERELEWLSANPPSYCYKGLWDLIQLRSETMHDVLMYQADLVQSDVPGIGVLHPVFQADSEALSKHLDEALGGLQEVNVQIEAMTLPSCQ